MRRILSISAAATLLAVGPAAGQSNIAPDHEFAWCENVGWTNWRDEGATNDGVAIGPGFLSGFAWFENTGHLNFGDGDGPYANTDGTNFGVNILPNGDLDGLAWHENLGWVNFGWAELTDRPDRARLDFVSNRFRGFAWMANAGWLNLDDETHYVAVENYCPLSTTPVAETLALTGSPVSTKNRFLSFSAGAAGRSQAVRVTFDTLPAPYDLWEGFSLWVGPTSLVSEAGAIVVPTEGFPNFTAAALRCTPLFTDWGAKGTIHVFHEGIVPNGDYHVEVIDESCDANVASSFSTALPMTTAIWGDTVSRLLPWPPAPPGDGVAVADALAVLERFASVPTAIVKARADLEPACLDLTINVSDVLASLSGFAGLDYPFTPISGDPCESTCRNVLP